MLPTHVQQTRSVLPGTVWANWHCWEKVCAWHTVGSDEHPAEHHTSKTEAPQEDQLQNKRYFLLCNETRSGWQPTHSLRPEVTHSCHKSGNFHQGAQEVTSHKLGCYQYQVFGYRLLLLPRFITASKKRDTHCLCPRHITNEHLPLSLQRQSKTQTKDFFPNPATYQMQESLCIISLRTQQAASLCWISAMRRRNTDSWMLVFGECCINTCCINTAG